MEGDCQKGSWQEGSGLIESVGKWIEVNRHEVGEFSISKPNASGGA